MQKAPTFGEITNRCTLGAYGRGQAAPFEMVAITDADGNVTIKLGAETRNFPKLSNGSYASMPGDPAMLTRDGTGRYHLLELNGIETIFRASDGKFGSNSDPTGKMLTASYN